MFSIATLIFVVSVIVFFVLYKNRHDILNKLRSADEKSRTDPVGYYTSFGLLIGMSLGLTIGSVVFDDTGVGLAVGMSFGIAIGAGIGASVKKKEHENTGE